MIQAVGLATMFRSASSISPRTITASSPAAFRHLPTNERQESGPLPVIRESCAKPSLNSRLR